MADAEQQQVVAAEPEECSRSAVIFLVGCAVAVLVSIAISVAIVLGNLCASIRSGHDDYVNALKLVALTLLLCLALGLAACILGILIAMLLHRHHGYPQGERLVDKLLLLW